MVRRRAKNRGFSKSAPSAFTLFSRAVLRITLLVLRMHHRYHQSAQCRRCLHSISCQGDGSNRSPSRSQSRRHSNSISAAALQRFSAPTKSANSARLIRRRFNLAADIEAGELKSTRAVPILPTTFKPLPNPVSTVHPLAHRIFNPAVQQAIHRIQSFEQTEAVIYSLREAGFDSINSDLIYGLPHQTAGFFCRHS